MHVPYFQKKETPPRAWGRHRQQKPTEILIGNTPTGVGKTWSPGKYAVECEKHPHGRGEDSTPFILCRHSTETPPRAWGRRWSRFVRSPPYRNTPTGVGKTQEPIDFPHPRRKHPHGRGEDPVLVWLYKLIWETPPRAWGRQTPSPSTRITSRNTPTGVGKTF